MPCFCINTSLRKSSANCLCVPLSIAPTISRNTRTIQWTLIIIGSTSMSISSPPGPTTGEKTAEHDSSQIKKSGLLPRNLHQRSASPPFPEVLAVIQQWQYYTSDHMDRFHSTLKPHWPRGTRVRYGGGGGGGGGELQPPSKLMRMRNTF